jgi:hypothetical protein
MKHSTPKVTIDLAEYLELMKNVEVENLRSSRVELAKLLTLHQMFIGRLYKELTENQKLTIHRKFERVATSLNACLYFKPKGTGNSQDIEIKPLG